MKTLNDYFSKIYCINLDRRPDKYVQCLEEFERLKINVERISAVDGKSITVPDTKWGVGNYGLVLTNAQIYKDAISNKYESILILEDDVMFIDKFYEFFYSKIEFLPTDWDILYLGGNNIFRGGKFNLITGNKNFQVNQDNYRILNHELAKTNLTYTTHAVGINSKFYDNIMRHINDNITEPIDNIYVKAQQDGTCNAYTFLPSLALQRSGFSDIDNRIINYNISTNGF